MAVCWRSRPSSAASISAMNRLPSRCVECRPVTRPDQSADVLEALSGQSGQVFNVIKECFMFVLIFAKGGLAAFWLLALLNLLYPMGEGWYLAVNLIAVRILLPHIRQILLFHSLP